MKLVQNISNKELNQIAETIGEAFVTNNLFNEFGNISKRRELVLKYMKAYVKFVYRSHSLYQSDDCQAFIGLSFSDKKAIIPQIKLLFSLVKIIPFETNKRFIKFIKEKKRRYYIYKRNIFRSSYDMCQQASTG